MNSITCENRGTCLSLFLVTVLVLELSGCASPTKALFAAASSGDTAAVQRLLQQGADLYANNRGGWTPLHCAAAAGHVDVVEQLLAEGVDVNVITGRRFRIDCLDPAVWKHQECSTPLHLAAGQGHLRTVELLMTRGVDVYATDEAGWTALHFAAAAGHVDVVEQLLAGGAGVNVTTGPGLVPIYIIDITGPYGGRGLRLIATYKERSTPLHLAAFCGHLRTVELLMTRGADPNIKQQDGDTPLHLAAARAHADIAALLLAHGADVNAMNKFGDTPLHLRIGIQLRTRIELKWDVAVEGTTIKLDSREDTSQLSKNISDYPIQWAYSATPLFAAVVRVLVANGAEVNARDAQGQTPLHSASRLHPEVAEVLLAKGADLNAQDRNKRTPLYEAAEAGLADMTRLLLTSGAAVNVRTKEGVTPLCAAIQRERPPFSGGVLLATGADLNAQGRNKRTPPHEAADYDKVITLLRQHGATESPVDGPAEASFPMAGEQAKSEQQNAARKVGLPVAQTLDLCNGVKLETVLIQAGKFRMGSSQAEQLKAAEGIKPFPGQSAAELAEMLYADEGPQHEVTISRPFYMGVHEVTQAQWSAVMGTTVAQHRDKADPSYPLFEQGDNHPMYHVSWDEAMEFCRKLSQKTGKTVRLPTEAEWEYACRAGTTTVFSFGDDYADLHKYANYCDRSNAGGAWWQDKAHNDGHDKTAPVGSFKPNAFGLYDMHGNVYEWCSDWYSKKYYQESPPVDPGGPSSGSVHVRRGGSWDLLIRP